MADQVEINQSKIRVAGIGGLGMVAMVPVIAYALPEVRQFLALAYGAGVFGPFAVIAYRRWMKPERPHGPILMVVDMPEGVGKPNDRSQRQTPAELVAVG